MLRNRLPWLERRDRVLYRLVAISSPSPVNSLCKGDCDYDSSAAKLNVSEGDRSIQFQEDSRSLLQFKKDSNSTGLGIKLQQRTLYYSDFLLSLIEESVIAEGASSQKHLKTDDSSVAKANVSEGDRAKKFKKDSRSLLQLKEDNSTTGLGPKLLEAIKGWHCEMEIGDVDHVDQMRRTDHGTGSMANLNFCQVSTLHQCVVPVGHEGPRCQRMYLPSQQQRIHLCGPFKPRFRHMSSCRKGQDGIEEPVPETKDKEQRFYVVLGDWQQLEKIKDAEVKSMENKVKNFPSRFDKFVKPILASSCLLLPNDLKHPSTLFVHKQTFKITNRYPAGYLSSFDVMSFWEGVCEIEEWQAFLDHIVERRVCIIKDWKTSISTVETLMYDHGIQAPNDGSPDDFLKGECDASFIDGTARLSVIIWKGDRIVHCEVYRDVKCDSATEAEAYAAFALLLKAAEMKIEKLLICSDSRVVSNILSGELSIGGDHPGKDLYLMLRSKKRLFKKLVVTWKPRELMIFADDLTKASDHALESTVFPEKVLEKWSIHLSGYPLFRIERTKDTGKSINKFSKAKVDESYGHNEFDTFFVEVEEDMKLQCLSALKQSLKPKKLSVLIKGISSRSESFQLKLGELVDLRSGMESPRGGYTSFTLTRQKNGADTKLVIVVDASIPEGSYYHKGAFHVIFLTPEERIRCTSEDHSRTGCTIIFHNGARIAELNALSYVYFNGVRFPLNDTSVNYNTKGREAKLEAEDGVVDSGEYSGEAQGEDKKGRDEGMEDKREAEDGVKDFGEYNGDARGENKKGRDEGMEDKGEAEDGVKDFGEYSGDAQGENKVRESQICHSNGGPPMIQTLSGLLKKIFGHWW